MTKARQFKWTDELVAKIVAEYAEETDKKYIKSMILSIVKEFKQKHSQPKYPEGIAVCRSKFNHNIISTWDRDKGYLKDYQEWVDCQIKSDWEIYTVKNSKGKEFSIGDKADFMDGNSRRTEIITKFLLHDTCDGGIMACYEPSDDDSWTAIDLLEVPKQPLFRTDDNANIYEGDSFVRVTKDSFEICSFNTSQFIDVAKSVENTKVIFKFFSCIASAEAWIKKNQPKYSEQQILDALQVAKVCHQDSSKDYLKEYSVTAMIKRKLGIKE